LRYQRTGLTSYAGLEFVRRWLHHDGLVAPLPRELATALPPTDYGVVGLVLAVLALLLSGGRRVRHLRYLDGDPIVLRFCGLRHFPTARTVGRCEVHSGWIRASSRVERGGPKPEGAESQGEARMLDSSRS
jgi:hypothetical protein